MANENIQELKFQVGEAWKGVYSPSTAYGLANVVQDPTGLSVYRSLKSGNVGHPVTDSAWWFCIIDLSSIKEESDRIAALNEAIAQDEALRVAAEELRQQHEAERVAAETQRNESEQARISAEQARVNAESARATAEQQRITAEQGRVSAESSRVQAEQARALAETLRANAEDQRAANEQNRVAAEQQRIDREQARETQYASDHSRAEQDHETSVQDNAQMAALVERADDDHEQAAEDHTRAESDHTTATSDHTQAGSDHTQAGSDHTTAAADHTQAGQDHTQAESDHTRAESDHAAVEVYVDSLGAFDISAYHATGGVLAKYADLTAALGTNGANIPEGIRKGGMSVKFVQSSDNNYVQFRYMGTAVTGTPNPFLDTANWQGVDDESTAGSNNLVKSGGVYRQLNGVKNYTNLDFESTNGKYINSEYGSVWNAATMSYTKPIPVKKGNIVTVYVGIMSINTVLVLGTVITEDSMYSKEIKGTNADVSYTWTAPKDCDIAISYVTARGFKLSIKDDSGLPSVYEKTVENAENIAQLSLVGRYKKGKIAIIGDSISTYSGYIPQGYQTYYPYGNVTNVNDTYWKIFANYVGADIQNLSGGNATITNLNAISLNARVDMIDEDASLILIALGTGDARESALIGDFDYNAELDSYDESQFAPAYIKGLRRIMERFPYADIILMSFKCRNDIATYAEATQAIAEHYNIMYYDARNDYSNNNVHPNKEGMANIAEKTLAYVSTAFDGGSMRAKKYINTDEYNNVKDNADKAYREVFGYPSFNESGVGVLYDDSKIIYSRGSLEPQRGYKISKPIHLESGDTVTVKVKSFFIGFNIIGIVNEAKYPLYIPNAGVVGVEGVYEYNYTAAYEQDISIGYSGSFTAIVSTASLKERTERNKTNISLNKEDIEILNKKEEGYVDIEIEVEETGKYIFAAYGNLLERNGFAYSKPLKVKAGQTVVVEFERAFVEMRNMAIISNVVCEKQRYNNIIIGVNGVTHYEKYCPMDTMVAISWATAIPFKVSIYENRVSLLDSISGEPTVVAPFHDTAVNGETGSEFDAENTTYAQIIAKADSIAEEYSGYISKDIMGKDSSGQYDMSRYVLTKRNLFGYKFAEKLYAWKSQADAIVYTDHFCPVSGDTVYSDSARTVYGSVSSYSSVNSEVTIGGVAYVRSSEDNISEDVIYTELDCGDYYTTFNNLPADTLRILDKYGVYIGTFAKKDYDNTTQTITFNEKGYVRDNKFDRSKDTKHTIILWSNEHAPQSDPLEPTFVLLRLMKDLASSVAETVPLLSYLKHYCKVIIMPGCNPYGITEFANNHREGRFNYNNVNINRNYDYNWENYTGDPKGISAGDQLEARNIMDSCGLFEPDIAIDIHCLGYINDSSYKKKVAYIAAITNVELEYLKREIEEYHNTYVISMGNPTTAASEAPGFIAYTLGIAGGLIEMTAGVENTPSLHSSGVMQLDYNYLLKCIRMFFFLVDRNLKFT